ncbi:MAG: dihydrofolate reductase [Firmicutes bacterium]|nr:dihydrofolate reductase [Bacillota bacterium]
MRKVVLFIAMSLDGYIADSDGGVDWLNGHDECADDSGTYQEFIKNVDTVVMGWNTYRQVAEELSPQKWIYSDLTSYVFTHKNVLSEEKIIFTNENPCHVVKRLMNKNGKNIWICGGANVVHQLMLENLIDVYHISIIPTVLGSGIRLFGNFENELKLRLIKTESYDGITDLVYEKT